MTDETILTNARIVTRESDFSGTVALRGENIVDVSEGRSSVGGARDLDGDMLMPGLIEMHTDNLEKHFVPRPGVVWPTPKASAMAHDAQVVSAGITTVYDALRVGASGGAGVWGSILVDSAKAIGDAQDAGLLRAEHFLHLRCELPDASVVEQFDRLADRPTMRLASLMDHTPTQRQWSDLEKYRTYLSDKKLRGQTLEEHIAVKLEEQAKWAGSNRRALVERLRDRDVPIASHDDAIEIHIDQAVSDGVTISEFPTTLEAARHARGRGMTTVMGAPNMVCGGSHSGNVSAAALARAGLLDGFSSDYVPISLLHAAILLWTDHGKPLPEAVATVTDNVARMLGLDDRGRIARSKRADLVRVRLVDGAPAVRAVWRAGVRVC